MQQEKNKEENIFIYYYFAKWMEENFTRLAECQQLNTETATGCSSFQDKHPVRLIVSVMIRCFSLTTKQHQPAYKPQKRSSERDEILCLLRSKGVMNLSSYWG